MIGSLSYGFTSLIYLIIITRVMGIEAAGQYSFAFAIAATFYVVGVYFGSAFQITDTSKKYTDSDYIYNRITTISFMIIMTLLFSLINGYNNQKLILIFLLVIYRGFDAIIDSFHAIIQKKDRIYKNGILTFVRTILLIITFLTTTILFKKLLYSVISIVILDFIFVFFVELLVVKKMITRRKYDNGKNIMLLVEGFSVFVFSFLAMYILNIPKYAIDHNLNNTLQGIFGIIFMPSSFMSMISMYMVQPFYNDISNCIKNKKVIALKKMIKKLSWIIFFSGVVMTLIAYLIGVPVLEFLYGIDLSTYRINLLIIMSGTIFYSLYCLLSSTLIALRKNNQQVVTLLFISAISIIICNVMTKKYGISGASYSYFIIMLIQSIIYVVLYLYYVNKLNKKEDCHKTYGWFR